jgi:hypothetical protein
VVVPPSINPLHLSNEFINKTKVIKNLEISFPNAKFYSGLYNFPYPPENQIVNWGDKKGNLCSR